MRKLLVWIVVTVGIAALARKLRYSGEPWTGDLGQEPDPADELRQKLADTREPGTHEPSPAPGEPAREPEIDDRRAEVHDEARATIDEMKQATEG